MSKKFKHIIAFYLLIVLLLPITVKLLDGLFHHHDHFHCTATNEKHFHKYHKKCPILSYEISLFSSEKPIKNNKVQVFFSELSIFYLFTPCCNNSAFSCLLRAPPVLLPIVK